MLWQIAIAVVIIYIYCKYFSKTHPQLDALPGPPRWPVLGCLPIFLGLNENDIFDLLNGFYKSYGSRVVMKIFHIYTVHVYTPKDIEVVLSHSKNITKNRSYQFMAPWLGTGLLLNTGTKWHKRRKILTPAFHMDILKDFATVFEEEARNMVADIQGRIRRGCDVVDLMPFVSDYTLYTICETAMGIRLNSGIDSTKSEYKESIHVIGQAIFSRLTRFWLTLDIGFYLSPTGWRFRKYLEKNFNFTNKVIEEKMKNRNEGVKRKRMALLDLLLEAESRGEIDMEGIRDEVNTFMFEGHDTTAVALTFGLMVIADHEDVQERIYEECRSIFGDSTRTANMSDLAEMHYLEAVIKEVLRIYPSVPFIGRMVIEEFKLDELVIPVGTEVLVHIYEMQRREDLFEDPLAFRPERFLNGDRMVFSYVPFSAGPRNCIGQRFAMQEMKYMLSDIIRHFKLAPMEKGYRPKMKTDLVLRPNEPILVKFTAR